MSRNKNAKRVYLVAPYVEQTNGVTPMPELPTRAEAMAVRTSASGRIENSEWATLAKFISSVSDETDEETDDTGFYDGDGTPCTLR